MVMNARLRMAGRTIAPVFFTSAAQLLCKYIAAVVHCVARLGDRSKELNSDSLIVLAIQAVHRATSLFLSLLFLMLIASMLVMGIAMATGYYLFMLDPKGLWQQAESFITVLNGKFNNHPATVTHA